MGLHAAEVKLEICRHGMELLRILVSKLTAQPFLSPHLVLLRHGCKAEAELQAEKDGIS